MKTRLRFNVQSDKLSCSINVSSINIRPFSIWCLQHKSKVAWDSSTALHYMNINNTQTGLLTQFLQLRGELFFLYIWSFYPRMSCGDSCHCQQAATSKQLSLLLIWFWNKQNFCAKARPIGAAFLWKTEFSSSFMTFTHVQHQIISVSLKPTKQLQEETL